MNAALTSKAAGGDTSGGEQTEASTTTGGADTREAVLESVLETLEAITELIRDHGFQGYVLIAMNDCYPTDIILDPKLKTLKRAKDFMDSAYHKVAAEVESYRGYV